ncbi:hypothetical protein Ndes2526B_g02825 [Nannochloris sp. 'desiccata']|nr:hypothetical protein KSW81_006910 [Chlorella desiccata (nom. nud.)]KAH7622000.1 putative 30S ribosomal protein S10 alpha, chloroplastic [Chlorella desiccata (nom. nud.)]
MSALTAAKQPVVVARPVAGTAQPMRTFSTSLAATPLAMPRASRVEHRLKAFRPAVAAAAAPANQKIRIKLKSYWVDLLQDSVEKIKEAAASTGATIAGPVPLPTRRRIYTVLRSPHVNKDSREQFELRTHQRLIDVKNLSSQTIDRLMQLDLPAGVDVEVKL